MNIRKKIAEIILLTLTVVMGGGFVYYTMLSDIQMDSTNIYIQKPVSPTVQLDNIYSTNSRRTSSNTQQKNVIKMPSAAATPLHRDVQPGMIATTPANNQPGNISYTYNLRNKRNSDTYQGSGYGTTDILAYGRRGSRTDGEVSTQGTGGITLTEPGATSPFAVPRNPFAPPSNGEGIILVDPMTDPLAENRIPVGEGWWILMLLALGYGVVKSPFATRRRVRSEE